eukprot:m.6821 g.6821  ORF g.6821 m.6821 type:complete len:181 (-) comp4777_c0_seq2:86-628(-)
MAKVLQAGGACGGPVAAQMRKDFAFIDERFIDALLCMYPAPFPGKGGKLNYREFCTFFAPMFGDELGGVVDDSAIVEKLQLSALKVAYNDVLDTVDSELPASARLLETTKSEFRSEIDRLRAQVSSLKIQLEIKDGACRTARAQSDKLSEELTQIKLAFEKSNASIQAHADAISRMTSVQ